jgi:hypothetical protein
MRRRALAIGLLAAAVACTRERSGWLLMQPPEVRDDAYPKGYHLLSGAPIAEWRRVATFDTEEACETARKQSTDDAIDQARETSGDEAKFDLTVRRAVNALCIRASAADAH